MAREQGSSPSEEEGYLTGLLMGDSNKLLRQGWGVIPPGSFPRARLFWHPLSSFPAIYMT